MKVPKYIQICIKRMLFHRKVVEHNTEIVNKWFLANDYDKNIPLKDLIDEKNLVSEKVPKGQLSIFDFIKEGRG